jgi:hypothetical protein
MRCKILTCNSYKGNEVRRKISSPSATHTTHQKKNEKMCTIIAGHERGNLVLRLGRLGVSPRRPAASYTGLLAHLGQAGADGAAGDATVEPAAERAGVCRRRAEAPGARRHGVLRNRPRRGHGRRLVRGAGGAVLADRGAGVLRRRLRHRELLDRRRPVQLQVAVHAERASDDDAPILAGAN